MNIREAIKIMEISSEKISKEELKSKYKELAKKYHPDVYKEDPNKFKTINEAYQFIQAFKDGKIQQNPFSGAGPFRKSGYGGLQDFDISDLWDIINQQQSSTYSTHTSVNTEYQYDFWGVNNSKERSTRINHPEPKINISLSFKESVIGCEKEICYERYIACNDCNGKTLKNIPNDCKECNGFGVISKTNGILTHQESCKSCFGKGVRQEKCKSCTDGCNKTNFQAKVRIPPGVLDGNILRLQGVGNFNNNIFGAFGYNNANIIISVEKHPKFKIENNDVVETMHISLLDAIKGKSIDVETVYSNLNINISPLTKNNDEIVIANCGVNNTGGSHRIKLKVDYPDDISSLVEFLESKQKTEVENGV